jgi:hypothetical protein
MESTLLLNTVTDCGFLLFDQNAKIHCQAVAVSFRMSESREKPFSAWAGFLPAVEMTRKSDSLKRWTILQYSAIVTRFNDRLAKLLPKP